MKIWIDPGCISTTIVYEAEPDKKHIFVHKIGGENAGITWSVLAKWLAKIHKGDEIIVDTDGLNIGFADWLVKNGLKYQKLAKTSYCHVEDLL